jgi:hypothetical protein
MGQSRRGTDPIVVLPAEHAGAEPQGCVAFTVFLGVEKSARGLHGICGNRRGSGSLEHNEHSHSAQQ